MSGRGGFSLVEALVVLALAGLLAAAAASLLPGLAHGARQAEGLARRTAELARVDDLVRQLAGRALRPADLGPGAAGPALAAAEAGFLAVPPPGLARGGPALVTLRAEGPPGQVRLRLAVEPLRPGGGPTGEGVLVEGARSAAWSYLDARAGRWLDAWPGDGTLPDLVRLRVDTPETGPWPDIVVRPGLDGGPFCAFDAVAGACRAR